MSAIAGSCGKTRLAIPRVDTVSQDSTHDVLLAPEQEQRQEVEGFPPEVGNLVQSLAEDGLEAEAARDLDHAAAAAAAERPFEVALAAWAEKRIGSAAGRMDLAENQAVQQIAAEGAQNGHSDRGSSAPGAVRQERSD